MEELSDGSSGTAAGAAKSAADRFEAHRAKSPIRPASQHAAGFELSGPFENKLQRISRDRGRPLAEPTLQAMAPSFSIDLSQVRVHDDSDSASLAQEIGARAFTIRNHVFFNRGEYAPHGRTGQRLLAHELAHVSQQADLPGGYRPGSSGETIRRSIKFHSDIGNATTSVQDKDGQIYQSDPLLLQFVDGLKNFFDIDSTMTIDDKGIATLTLAGDESTQDAAKTKNTQRFNDSKIVKMLTGPNAKKVLVPKPRDGVTDPRTSEAEDYRGVDLAELEARYAFVRQTLVARLSTGTLNVQLATTSKGKSTAIRYQEETARNKEHERIEVNRQEYSKILISEQSGWDGFWILAHEILHSAGRGDDEIRGLADYYKTTKYIDVRGLGGGGKRQNNEGEQGWTSIGQPEYDLNFVRMVEGMPLRSGYADKIGPRDDSDAIVRFSNTSAPARLAGKDAVPYPSVANGEDFEYIGAYMNDTFANRRAFEEKALQIINRERLIWNRILLQGHPGTFRGREAQFALFGSHGLLRVEFVIDPPEDHHVELEFETTKFKPMNSALEPEIINVKMVGIVSDDKNQKLENGSVSLMDTWGPSPDQMKAAAYKTKKDSIMSGGVEMSGKLDGSPMSIQLYGKLEPLAQKKKGK